MSVSVRKTSIVPRPRLAFEYRWRKRRAFQLRLEPLCAICARSGLAVPATIADHVDPHRGDLTEYLTGRLQSLCKPCHDSEKRYLELRGYERPTIGVDGYPIEERGGAPSITTTSLKSKRK